MPVELRSHRALVFGDAVCETGGGSVRVWDSPLDSENRKRWWSDRYLPTLQELGMKDFTSRSFYGVMLRSGTPQPIIDKWNAAIRAALQKPEVQAKLRLLGIDPIGSTQADYADYLKAEDAKYGEALALPSVAGALK